MVIPALARPEAMNVVHAGHKRIVAMKSSARSYVSWPGIGRDIEEAVGSCPICQESRKIPSKAPLPTWDHASLPSETLYLDFAGPLETNIFLVVADAYTKWLEVRSMTNATSAAVTKELRGMFATF